MSYKSIFQLFTTWVTRLVRAPQRRVGIDVTTYEGLVAHLQTSKIKRVRNASRSDGNLVGVVEFRPFPTGKLNLDCEAF